MTYFTEIKYLVRQSSSVSPLGNRRIFMVRSKGLKITCCSNIIVNIIINYNIIITWYVYMVVSHICGGKNANILIFGKTEKVPV